MSTTTAKRVFATIEQALTLDLQVVDCPRVGCGVVFATTREFDARRRYDGANFYCPNGHVMCYGGEESQLREEARKAKARADRIGRELDEARVENVRLERQRRALRGVATRLRNKAKAGQCAFCEAEFSDLRAHIAEAHPDEDPEQVDEG